MWRQKRSVLGNKFTTVFQPKTQNLARTWQRITQNKKGPIIGPFLFWVKVINYFFTVVVVGVYKPPVKRLSNPSINECVVVTS